VLLCHRTRDREWFPNVWDLPGGHIDANETAPVALARELHEELGIAIDAPGGAAFVGIDDPEHDLHLQVWVITDWRGDPANCAPDEHDRIAWFREADLAPLALADDRYRALIHTALGGG
jgi:8-oxo-dGTP diphosphatase